MKAKAFQLVFLICAMFAGQVTAIDIDFSTTEKAKLTLEQALKLCSENLEFLDKLLSDEANQEGKRLEYAQKVTQNALSLTSIALECVENNKGEWPSELLELISTFKQSMKLQKELMDMAINK
jgi:hypothetical protein